MIRRVESDRDIPRYGDGNDTAHPEFSLSSDRDIPRYGDGN